MGPKSELCGPQGPPPWQGAGAPVGCPENPDSRREIEIAPEAHGKMW